MTKHILRPATIGLALCTLAWSACAASNGGGSPVGYAPPQATNAQSAAKAAELSGQYAGTVKDNKYGKGHAAASLARRGKALGGALLFSFKKSSIPSSIVGSVTPAGAFKATAVATVGKSTCTLAVTGTYDASTYELSGSYRAVTGCSGDTGTYAMKQQCYYKGDAIRPQVAGLKPC